MAVVERERIEPHIERIRINRPESRNALNSQVRTLLRDYVVAAAEDDEVRCIVLTGDEVAFAAGADLKEIAGLDTVAAMQRRTHELLQPIADCPKPVIAAVNGYALGGGLELALLCDIMVVAEDARLGLPEVRVGVMPGAGGTQRLTRIIGRHRTMLLALTGRPINGRDAFALGLASQVVAPEQVLETSLGIARTIARMPPLGVRLIKEAINAGADASLASALTLERRCFQLLFATADHREGIEAFLEKRRPEFTGR